MRPMLAVIGKEIADQMVEILLAENYKFREALKLNNLNDSFTSSVQVWCCLGQGIHSHIFAN